MEEYEVYNPEEPKKNKKNLPVKFIVIIIAVVAIVSYFLSGIYVIGPAEVAVVKTFGEYSYTADSGINFHLPVPFQSHVKLNVKEINKIEIGFRTSYSKYGSSDVFKESEANMITGDQNILSIQAVIQYYFKDPVKYVFNIMEHKDLVRIISESILREQVATSEIDEVLTYDRDKIAFNTAIKVQELLDKYDSGIIVENVYLQDVTPPKKVVEAFDDVNDAKQDKEKIINESQRYYNDKIPRAEGEAQKILREAEAYSYSQIAKATGETKRFISLLNEYEMAQNITKQRIVLEAIKDFLENAKLKIVSNSDNGNVNLLNLDKLIGGDLK